MVATLTGTAQELTVAVDLGGELGCTVSGLLAVPDRARACLVLAHGAGAGMTHPFMAATADGLVARGIACLRYQFPFTQAGSKGPDRPAVATATVRAAVAAARETVPHLALFAGGKSFGGRMTSTAQAANPMPGVRGLVFLGFPLHPAGKPATERAGHLGAIGEPMLFVQGTRDTLADPGLLQPMVAALGPRATLLVVEGADHSFHVATRRGRGATSTPVDRVTQPGPTDGPGSGRTDADVLAAIVDDVVTWITARAA